jgi:DNA-directed RNA polymerase subunit E'/Rpb7
MFFVVSQQLTAILKPSALSTMFFVELMAHLKETMEHKWWNPPGVADGGVVITVISFDKDSIKRCHLSPMDGSVTTTVTASYLLFTLVRGELTDIVVDTFADGIIIGKVMGHPSFLAVLSSCNAPSTDIPGDGSTFVNLTTGEGVTQGMVLRVSVDRFVQKTDGIVTALAVCSMADTTYPDGLIPGTGVVSSIPRMSLK